MRHPVSTLATSGGSERLSGAMAADVVECVVLPAAPEHTDPGASDDANSMGMSASTSASALVDERGPARGVTGVIGESRQRSPEAFVACPSKHDGAVLARSVRDGRQAGFGGELCVGGEPGAVITELGEDLRRVDRATTRKTLHEATVGMLRHGRRDRRGELLDVGHEWAEDGDQGANKFAAGFGFGVADLAHGGAAEAGEQIGHGPATTVGVLSQELGESLFPEVSRAVRRGIAREEREGDRRVDVGKDGGGPGPESLEQGAELIRERYPLGHEIIAAAHEGTQRACFIRRRMQRTEAVAIGPKQVSEDEGIAGIALTAGGRVARSTGLERVRVNRADVKTGIDERVHENAGGTFEGSLKRRAAAEAAQAIAQRSEAVRGVRYRAAPTYPADVIDDANGVHLAGPVDPDEESHCVVSEDGETLRRERSCRSLTDWRSGLAGHVARHPVAGLGLSSFYSEERISFWPSRGKRMRLSPNPVPAPSVSDSAGADQEMRSRIALRSDDRRLGNTSVPFQTPLFRALAARVVQ